MYGSAHRSLTCLDLRRPYWFREQGAHQAAHCFPESRREDQGFHLRSALFSLLSCVILCFSDTRTCVGPPGQVAALAGKKDGFKQGALSGVLKELGYTEDQVSFRGLLLQ